MSFGSCLVEVQFVFFGLSYNSVTYRDPLIYNIGTLDVEKHRYLAVKANNTHTDTHCWILYHALARRASV